MNTLKSIKCLILVALMIATPVHSDSFFDTCIKGIAFGVGGQLVVEIVKAPRSAQIKIGVGLTALIGIYALIRYIIYKHDAAFFEKRGIKIESIKGSFVELTKAVENNDAYLVYKLLKYGALVNPYGHGAYFTVLGTAISEDHTLLDLILRNAEDVDKELAKSALNVAVEESIRSENAVKSIEVIVRQNKHIAPIIDGDVLSRGALKGPKTLNVLIELNRKLGKFKKTDLNQAVFHLVEQDLKMSRRDSMELLIKQGADIDAKQKMKFSFRQVTPLANAILIESLPMIQFFLEKGASLEITPERNVYDCIKKGYGSGKQIHATLDNHRREIADKYTQEVRTEVNKHLFAGPAGIVMGYVESVYPLMDKHPLESFEDGDMHRE